MPHKDPQARQEYLRQWRQKQRRILNEHKAKPCADCGHEYPPQVMEFDHARGKKLFEVGAMARLRMGGRDRDRLLRTELAKCDVVCANCHRLRHIGRGTLGNGMPTTRNQ